MWMTGPMKPITKYGGLPKPTGCVWAPFLKVFEIEKGRL
jgi:hypothetical protein